MGEGLVAGLGMCGVNKVDPEFLWVLLATISCLYIFVVMGGVDSRFFWLLLASISLYVHLFIHLMYITMATTFSHAYTTQRRPHTGIIAIPMYIK